MRVVVSAAELHSRLSKPQPVNRGAAALGRELSHPGCKLFVSLHGLEALEQKLHELSSWEYYGVLFVIDRYR